ILVTTSHFGSDAYNFAKDKPLSLIDGDNLLQLLIKHNFKAKIDIQEARKTRIGVEFLEIKIIISPPKYDLHFFDLLHSYGLENQNIDSNFLNRETIKAAIVADISFEELASMIFLNLLQSKKTLSFSANTLFTNTILGPFTCIIGTAFLLGKLATN